MLFSNDMIVLRLRVVFGALMMTDIDDDAKEIVYRNYVDISVAVSSPNGLVVPVIRNVEDMSKNSMFY